MPQGSGSMCQNVKSRNFLSSLALSERTWITTIAEKDYYVYREKSFNDALIIN